MKNNVKIVKEAGDKTGYGNLMLIASALWKKELIEKNLDISEAKVPVKIIDNEIILPTKEEIEMFDDLVKIMH